MGSGNEGARNGLRVFAKVVISVTLMIWLLSQVSFGDVVKRWEELDWLLLVVAIPGIHLITILLRAIRLRTILRGLGLNSSLWTLSLAQLKGVFVTSFLPGQISGDVYRTYLISKETGRSYESIAGILVEKTLGAGALVLVCVMSLVYAVHWIGQPAFEELVRPVVVLATVFLVSCVVAGVVGNAGLGTGRLGATERGRRVREILRQVSSLLFKRWCLVTVLLLSVLLQMAVVVFYFTVARAIHYDLPAVVFLVTIPLLELVLLLPISVGGLGVRDVALVYLLAPFDVSVAQALALSLLSFVVSTTMKILSGAAYLCEGYGQGRAEIAGVENSRSVWPWHTYH